MKKSTDLIVPLYASRQGLTFSSSALSRKFDVFNTLKVMKTRSPIMVSISKIGFEPKWEAKMKSVVNIFNAKSSLEDYKSIIALGDEVMDYLGTFGKEDQRIRECELIIERSINSATRIHNFCEKKGISSIRSIFSWSAEDRGELEWSEFEDCLHKWGRTGGEIYRSRFLEYWRIYEKLHIDSQNSYSSENGNVAVKNKGSIEQRAMSKLTASWFNDVYKSVNFDVAEQEKSWNPFVEALNKEYPLGKKIGHKIKSKKFYKETFVLARKYYITDAIMLAYSFISRNEFLLSIRDEKPFLVNFMGLFAILNEETFARYYHELLSNILEREYKDTHESKSEMLRGSKSVSKSNLGKDADITDSETTYEETTQFSLPNEVEEFIDEIIEFTGIREKLGKRLHKYLGKERQAKNHGFDIDYICERCDVGLQKGERKYFERKAKKVGFFLYVKSINTTLGDKEISNVETNGRKEGIMNDNGESITKTPIDIDKINVLIENPDELTIEMLFTFFSLHKIKFAFGEQQLIKDLSFIFKDNTKINRKRKRTLVSAMKELYGYPWRRRPHNMYNLKLEGYRLVRIGTEIQGVVDIDTYKRVYMPIMIR